ncbi:MAG TPA: DNA adenine methylase [Pirellulales bacterium]|nr:DNA adenine methylase [Pirellulales bacterium]
MPKKAASTTTVVNVASVPHRSVFRYPGGKTWLVPHVRKWLSSIERPAEFAEPFAGGGIVALSVLFDDLADRITLIELDRSIAAVWKVILNGKGAALADRIISFKVSEPTVREILSAQHRNLFDLAFATILRNRMQRGGIMAPGAALMKEGENGKGLRSRWYAQTLKNRIVDIVQKKAFIKFIQGDGIAFMRRNASRADIAYLIDPPYTVAGRRLYAHSEIDHEQLFKAAEKLQGDFLMTYDNVPPVRELAKAHGLDTQEIAMKNTHHAVMSELLIGRNLAWAR